MDTNRLIENRTLMATRCTPIDDHHGREVLAVIAKMTWAVSENGEPTIALPGSPVRFSPEPYAAGVMSSAKFPDELVPEKPGTDVLLVGTAYPPRGKSVTERVVSLRIETGEATLQKSVKVYGPRVWMQKGKRVVPGPAAQLEPTPLAYELAYGGHDLSNEVKPVIELRNPVGKGVAANPASLIGKLAPQIESLDAPLDSKTPAPAGTGPLEPSWSPRSELVGTYDATWARTRAPLRPADFDPRHYSCAPADQWLETPLVGAEAVEVLGATPAGTWRFQLPHHEPVFVSTLRSGEEREHETHLDTFLIDADGGRVELTWRVSIPLPRKIDLLEKVSIYALGQLPPEVVEDLRQRVMPRDTPETS